MYMVWHVDKYKITFKLVINSTNEILQHIVVSSSLSRPGVIDARARWLRNTALFRSGVCVTHNASQNYAPSKMNVTYLLTYLLHGAQSFLTN